MSRVGLNPIKIESGINVEIKDGGKFGHKEVFVKGPKGELCQSVTKGIDVDVKDGEVVVSRSKNTKDLKSKHGLYRSLIANMISGVSKEFVKELQLVGVGYRVNLKGTALDFALGLNHPVIVEAPAGISFEVKDNEFITIKGIDKQLVGETAAKIRAIRKPEPYKGKGIRYVGEQVRRKAGKTAASSS